MLKIGSRVTCLPIVHGSGDFAWEVRRLMLKNDFDCIAIPLPPSFQTPVEEAILNLPTPSIVFQKDLPEYHTAWTPENQSESGEAEGPNPQRTRTHQNLSPGQAMFRLTPAKA